MFEEAIRCQKLNRLVYHVIVAGHREGNRILRRGFSTAILPVIALIALSGCAGSPSPQDADGGPSFIQMPGDGQLVGATAQVLDAAFGKPAILRVDGAAQVWLYHDGECGLNLVLYPDNAGTPRVAMAAPTEGGDAAACSAALERDHVAGLTRPVDDAGPAMPEASLPFAAPLAPAARPSVGEPGLDGPGAAGGELERPSSS